MIHVIAIITAKPGKRDEILKNFKANVPAVHAEKGCIEYGATLDTDGGPFAKFGPDTFVVIEKWADVAALNAHAARHFGARDINWMHASYGLGATIGPLLVTALAVVVAAPCTAPFMGTAVGFAFTQPRPATGDDASSQPAQKSPVFVMSPVGTHAEAQEVDRAARRAVITAQRHQPPTLSARA